MSKQQTDALKVLVALALLSVPPTAFGKDQNRLALQALKVENARTDAENAIGAKDYRLLAVRGYTVEVPGAGNDVSALEKRYGIKIIEGTSDYFAEHDRKLQENARAYAKQYNEMILKSQALSIEQAFDGALKAINEERAKNRTNEFGCTQFFADFYRVKKIEPYVTFFKGREIQAAIADVNQDHYVSFNIPYRQLRAWGYRNFYRDDRLVLVFTTGSSKSDDITSFSARLFGRDYP